MIFWLGVGFLSGFLVRGFFRPRPIRQEQRQRRFNPVSREVALAQYTELSQDWRLHAGDIWKYLITIFAIHAGVYASELQSLRGRNGFLFLLFTTIGLVYAALKSAAVAHELAGVKRKIEQHLRMLPIDIEELVRRYRVFRRWSTLCTMIGLVFLLVVFDYIFLHDP